MRTVVAINSAAMGHGDSELGARLIQSMLTKLPSLAGVETLVFYNAGVKLLADGSPCLQMLAALEESGVELIACGTCVDYYGLREGLKVGQIGSMDGILAAMGGAEKVITV